MLGLEAPKIEEEKQENTKLGTFFEVICVFSDIHFFGSFYTVKYNEEWLPLIFERLFFGLMRVLQYCY